MQFDRVWTTANWERLLVGDLASQGVMGGLLLTLLLGVSSIGLATLLGTIIGVLRDSPWRLLRAPFAIYVQAFRNLPLLILVFWAYFFPAAPGLQLSEFTSVLVALPLVSAASCAENVRGGFGAASRGHIEAARALSMGPLQIVLWLVLPQAIFSMLPAIAGRDMVTIRNTSLAFLIGVSDLTEIGK